MNGYRFVGDMGHELDNVNNSAIIVLETSQNLALRGNGGLWDRYFDVLAVITRLGATAGSNKPLKLYIFLF